MSATLTEDIMNDGLAVSLARVIAAANKQANELGIDAVQSLITITQSGENVWRVNYGSKDYVGRRGGDLIVDVDANDASIKRVLRGQ